MARNFSVVVFSHLRWDFVYQRPQHLLSRMAGMHPIIFIEEPEHSEEREPSWRITTPEENVVVCRPCTNLKSGGFSDAQMKLMEPMVRELLGSRGVRDYVVWLYTPMALPLARALNPLAVVFDCMDELSAFKFAPRSLVKRERELMEMADVVFTGGPSLYEAKKHRHPNIHCFPSSVDAAHFGMSRFLPEADDQMELAAPRLGFYGVIDERLDLQLIDHLAKARPDWEIVMVGPVVKIDPAELPRHPNLHYFGQRSYNELPKFLAGWDVCLLPFARNESTRFISPTKTLEYFAAGLPVVSTPITDVAGPYGHIVYLADTPSQFVDACDQALADSDEERERRLLAMRDVLAQTSWETTAAQMQRLIMEAVNQRKAVFVSNRPAPRPSAIEEALVAPSGIDLTIQDRYGVAKRISRGS